jgi:hypothetical protein
LATTVNRDLVASDDPLAIDLPVSMDEQVAMLDRDTTQFATMLMKLPVSTAKSFQEQWEEDQYLPRNTALSVTAAAADTTLTLTTNEGNYAKIGDIGKFVQTGEAFRITTVGASAWTVVRAIGSVSAATAASGTTQGGIIIISGSNEQGGTLPTAIVTQKTSNYNYLQVIRNSYRFTSTAEWIKWYSGNPLTYHRKKIGVEHKREIEQSLWFGVRSYTSGTNAPRTTMGGADEYLSTNITDVAGTLDKGAFNDFTRGGLEYGERSRKVLFASPIVAQVLSEFLQDNWVMTDGNATVWGVNVDAVIGAAHGAKIPVIVKNDWKRFGEGTAKHIGSRAYLLDMTNVELVKAPPTSKGPRYCTLYPDREANDADETAEEYLSEVAAKFKVEKAHALMRGVTG